MKYHASFWYVSVETNLLNWFVVFARIHEIGDAELLSCKMNETECNLAKSEFYEVGYYVFFNFFFFFTFFESP